MLTCDSTHVKYALMFPKSNEMEGNESNGVCGYEGPIPARQGVAISPKTLIGEITPGVDRVDPED